MAIRKRVRRRRAIRARDKIGLYKTDILVNGFARVKGDFAAQPFHCAHQDISVEGGLPGASKNAKGTPVAPRPAARFRSAATLRKPRSFSHVTVQINLPPFGKYRRACICDACCLYVL